MNYHSRLYETLFESKEKYSRKLLKIPTPEFYVFYNGEEAFPRDKTLKLSDAFIEQNEYYHLELTVKVININQQNQHPILEHCQTMYEYSLFVDTVRKWKEVDPISGFQKAIEECIANNILKDYLKRKTKEVLNMLLAEYDYETDIAVQRAEERELAFTQGIEQGISQGRSEGIAQGSYQRALETAKNLLGLGLSIENIAQATGLSKQEVEEIK